MRINWNRNWYWIEKLYVCSKYAQVCTWILCILINIYTKSQFVLTNLMNDLLDSINMYFSSIYLDSLKLIHYLWKYSIPFYFIHLTFIPFCDILRQISKQEWHFTLICVLWHFASSLRHFASKVTFCVKFATFRVKSDILR